MGVITIEGFEGYPAQAWLGYRVNAVAPTGTITFVAGRNGNCARLATTNSAATNWIRRNATPEVPPSGYTLGGKFIQGFAVYFETLTTATIIIYEAGDLIISANNAGFYINGTLLNNTRIEAAIWYYFEVEFNGSTADISIGERPVASIGSTLPTYWHLKAQSTVATVQYVRFDDVYCVDGNAGRTTKMGRVSVLQRLPTADVQAGFESPVSNQYLNVDDPTYDTTTLIYTTQPAKSTFKSNSTNGSAGCLAIGVDVAARADENSLLDVRPVFGNAAGQNYNLQGSALFTLMQTCFESYNGTPLASMPLTDTEFGVEVYEP